MATQNLVKVTCDGCGRVVEQNAIATVLPEGWVAIEVKDRGNALDSVSSGDFCSKRCGAQWLSKRRRKRRVRKAEVGANTSASAAP